MNKYKIYFRVLLIINIVVIGYFVFNNYIYENYGKNVKNGDLDYFSYMLNGEVPVGGYVSDGKLAVKIGKIVLEDRYIKPGFGYSYEVMYDKKTEAWIVHGGNLFSGSAYVVISKRGGTIIKAWKAKR